MLSRNTIKLLRIPFSLFLMPVFLLAVSQATQLNLLHTFIVFVIIHLLVYPASNGYNSYIDRDEASIGGLEKPPLPTKELFYITLILDATAITSAAFLINPGFSLAILLYILASRAYSSKLIRLKKYAFSGFAVVVFFQGAFTYFMSAIAISEDVFVLKNSLYILIATSLQIAGAYPLTQIYQHKQDAADGVQTISMKLGIRGTFIFTASMFALCNLFYFLHFSSQNQSTHFYILQAFFLPIVLYFSYWFIRVLKDQTQANFKNTMFMNMLASGCMSAFFVLLIFLNHIL
jgi:1,4-dihydroxy-2-naphthoate octaprenyltransferase